MLARSILRALVVPTALAALAVAAPAASAADLLSTTVSTDAAKFRRCHDGLAQGAAGVTTRRVTVTDAGLVWARLSGSDAADWDLAVFDAQTGRAVAGSAGPRSNELAEGFTLGGRDLIVQACRLDGDSTSPTVTVSSFAQEVSTTTEAIQLVRVNTPTRQDKTRLTQLGLDLTEHGGPGFVEVVLYGAPDAARLETAGFTWTVKIPDMVARTRANRRADAEFAAATGDSGLPSGRDSYRRLADYEADLKELAFKNPGLVKLTTLNHRSLEGRDVLGVEITPDVNVSDGKPVFLQMGVHHAREWPSSEHAIEWAFEVVNAVNATAAGTAKPFQTELAELAGRVRTIVVPVVNPDGFNLSREAPVDLRVLGDAHPLGHVAAIVGDPGFAYKRRNCRVREGATPDPGECGLRTNRNRGVDPNRNYGGLWGGPGANVANGETYRGAGPFSEPETQNIRELVSERQVTALITNHTYSNLVLRPPGVAAQGPPPDEAIYKALGDEMALQNGYTSQKSYQLYDTTGTTEDWTYTATGGLGFTFEIGPEEFHPPFEDVVGEYTGTRGFEGKGNRAAYMLAMQAAGDTAKHAVIEGNAKPGNVIRLRKTFMTSTHDPKFLDDGGEATDSMIEFEDTLNTSLTVPESGKFSLHANPSTRPAVAERTIVKLADTPSRTDTYKNTTPTVPGGGATDPPNIVEKEFTVTEADAAEGVVVHLLATNEENNDYDLYVYRVLDDGARVPVASGADADGDETAIVEKPVPGRYVYRVVNWLASEPTWDVTVGWYKAGETVFEAGTVESWTLTCETPEGTVLAEHKVIADRGDTRKLSGVCNRRTK